MKTKNRLFSIAFLSPALLFYSIFLIIPVLSSVYISVTKWSAGVEPAFVGFDNYIRIFTDSQYWKVVGNTFQLVGFSLLLQVPAGILLAYLIFRAVKGSKFFRSVFFVPVVIAPVAIGLMFLLFYDGNLGPLNKILEFVGLQPKSWLSNKDTVLYSVIFPQVWQYIGFFTVIILAALRSLPIEIFESAQIDGASSSRVFFRLVVPMIWEAIQICIILCVTGSLKSFDHAWILTQGGPGVESSYLTVFMYKMAFTKNRFGVASAITMTIMTFSVGFTVIFKRFFSRTEVY